METLQLIDLKQICRVCLQSEMLISLYSAIPYSQFLRPIDMIMKLDLFKIEIDDNMPNSICQSCVYRLMDAFTLKQQCEATETHLKEYLNISSTNSTQFPYLGTKNYITFSDFPDTRFEEENSFSKLNYQTAIQNTIPTSSSISPPIFNTLNCDIFETNNSEDIEVADDVLNEVDESFVDVVGESLVFKINDMKDQIFFESPPKDQEHETIFNDENSINETSKQKSGKIDCKDAPKPYKCSECLKIFKSNVLLDIHMRIHSDIKPYTCEICNKSFRQIGNFNLHRRIHLNDRRYQCEMCSRLFSTSSNLKSHMRSHSSVRNFKCNICEKGFKAEIELKRHLKTHKDRKEYFCELCNRAFLNTSYLKGHISSVHENKKKYSCTECNKSFASSSNLIVHQRIHSGVKPFKCKICDAKFNQSQALTRHEKLHNNNNNDVTNLETQTLPTDNEENNIDIEKSESEIHNNDGQIANYDKSYKLNISDFLPTEMSSHDQSIIPFYKHIQCSNNNDILNHSSTIIPSYSFTEIQTTDLNSIVSTYHNPNSMQRSTTTEHIYQTQTNYDYSKDISYKNLHRSFE